MGVGEGGGGEAVRAHGGYTFTFVIFSCYKNWKLSGLSESMFARFARESKVEVVEGGFTHTNWIGCKLLLT